jgi:hypothetical protein
MTRRLSTVLAASLLIAPAYARIVRIVIEQRDTSAFQAQSFGPIGAYQRLSGHVYGELDPKSPLNSIITDIEFAPRNARGMVEYSATFSIAIPADLSKASGVLFYEVPNRGRAPLPAANARAAGMADLFTFGHIVLTSGWQGDLAPAPNVETISVPVAKAADGSSLTGPVLVRFSDMAANTNTLALRGRQPPAPAATPATLDTSKATLTRRAAEGREIVPIRSTDWAFADCSAAPFPGKPDPDKICLKNGFDPAYLYELVYTAKDPLVLGIGFAATRDLTSFFRYASKDDSGTANPIAGKITHTLARGDSQSGNFLRSLVHLGFNHDEGKKIVFDGINPNIAVRQLAMDFRFASPSGAAALYEPGSDAVQTWSVYTDEARHRPAASLLDRCTASNTCPKVFETFGASEFWNLRGSPNLVGAKADKDIPLPANVRRYFFPGVTHGGGTGGFSTNVPAPPRACELPNNPNPSSDTLRALTVDLVDWVTKGTAPPPSQYPRLDHGDLVEPTQAALGFPMIPGVPLPDNIQLPMYEYDFGPKFNYNDMRGVISMEPPAIRQVLPSLAPKVDADGNEPSGVASVLHQAPLGSYLGWNVTSSGFAKGSGCGLVGGYVPFAKTKAERLAAGDPRLSIEERYGTHEKYVEVVRAAAAKLVHDRFLLQADADRLIAEADASNVLRSPGK